MEMLIRYMAPIIGAERWQPLWTAINLCCGVASTAIVYTMYDHGNRKKRPFGPQPLKMKKWILMTCLSVFTLYIMGFVSEYLKNPDVEFPLYNLIYPILDFIDKFLNLRNLYAEPIGKLPLGNMGICVVRIWLLLYLTRGIFCTSHDLSVLFSNYLDDKLSADNTAKFAMKVWKALKKYGVMGGTAAATAVVVTKDTYREKITEVLSWLYDTLSQITLLSRLPQNASTIPELAYGFFVVIFSILIVAVYLLLIVAVAAVAHVLWEKRREILKQFKDWFKNIGYILLIVGAILVVVLFTVLIGTKNDSFQSVITQLVQNSPRMLFGLLQHTVLILVAIGVVAIMGFTLAALFMFGVNYLKAWSKTLNVPNAVDAKVFVKRYAPGFAICLLMVGVILGYDPIRGWLIDRFADDGSGYGPWWVTFQICSGIVALVVLAAVVLLAIYMAVFLAAAFYREVKEIQWKKQHTAPVRPATPAITRGRPLGERVGEYVSNLIETIFRIFRGYQTEDQKNSAIYVAACFASLASLVNTAVGLHDFNIGWILAVTMSFAIQLAMLIFGMKAGQGIAENLVSGVKHVGASVLAAVLRKCAAGICYVLSFFAVKYGVSILAGEGVLSLSLKLLSQKETFWPVLLLWISALVFGYGLAKQILEAGVLLWNWGAEWFAERKNKKRTSIGSGVSAGMVLSNPRRVPARYPLIAYMLFMVVSTGFAFTNLFGGYANQVQLHARVYDQVYSETEKKLELQDKALGVLKAFTEKSNSAKTILQEEIETVLDQHAKNLNYLKDVYDNPTKHETSHNAAGEKKAYYDAGTVDLVQFCGILESVLDRDYDSFGEDMNITVYEYAHYVCKDQDGKTIPNRVDVLYTTKALRVTFGSSGAEDLVIGRINNNEQDTDGRRPDIDKDSYEVAEMVREIPSATKYTLLNELLSMFRSYQETVEACQSEQDNGEDPDRGNGNPEEIDGDKDTDVDELIKLLGEIELLDDVRRNIAQLYFAAYSGVEKCVSMIDLPRVMDLYLMQDEPAPVRMPGTVVPAETAVPTETTVPSEPTKTTDTTVPSETTVPLETEARSEDEPVNQKYDKLEAYKDLSNYVDRAIQVYNILNVAEDVLNETPAEKEKGESAPLLPTEPGGTVESTQTSEPGDTTGGEQPLVADREQDKLYTIRKYRSYARGVASSNFQISFDALLEGEFGLNGTKNGTEGSYAIDALYSAQMVAVFILIICALVDFMAFFSGLMLFQDAFVFDMEKRSKLSRLGYINYDAVLTKYFMPTEVNGKHQKLQIALIYYLLYGKVAGIDMKLVGRLDVNPDALIAMVNRAGEFLKGYGTAVDNADFHGWLESFAEKNGIDFEGVLK